MRREMLVAAAAAAAAAGASAQQPATTVQQDFEAASVLSEGNDPAAALAAWDALARRASRSVRTLAVIEARRAPLLLQLGRRQDASTAAEAALARLSPTDATLADDRFEAMATVAAVRTAALDYAGAAAALTAAEATATAAPMKLRALAGLIEVQTFVDPVAARAALDRADRLLAITKVDATSQAIFARRRALLALNTGDLATAQTESQRAVKLLGGLTARTDGRDVSARGDAALALILAGHPDRAREYLALTGAGRIPNTGFDPAQNMIVPDCGGEASLKPADLAVIEFTMGDDGAVAASRPIYAAGGPRVGLEFARAVSSWSWTPEQVKQLPFFYRNNVRIEMRCSTGFERPSVTSLLAADLDGWLDAKGVAVPEPPANDAIAAPAQRAALAAAEARDGRDSIKLLPALLALERNAVVGREETHGLAVRSVAIGRANAAPPSALLALVIGELSTAGKEGSERAAARALEPLLADPVFAQDPRSRAALRLILADRLEGDAGSALLRQVVDDPALKPDDPARVGALVRLASRAQGEGDTAAARASFAKAGIAVDQCALLDSPPKMLGYKVAFPYEARSWGFEGWTLTQFDVDPAGKVANERTILSYPAFVFSQAGTTMMRGATFSKSYRPDGALGCGALTQRVRFSLQQ